MRSWGGGSGSGPFRSGRDFDHGRVCLRLRRRHALGAHSCEMQFDRSAHCDLDFRLRCARGDATRQIRREGGVTGGRSLDDDENSHFRPACLRMLWRVPGARSSEGRPATVTNPGFVGCLNCWWLPVVRARYQPSTLSERSTSRTFIVRREREVSRVASKRTQADVGAGPREADTAAAPQVQRFNRGCDRRVGGARRHRAHVRGFPEVLVRARGCLGSEAFTRPYAAPPGIERGAPTSDRLYKNLYRMEPPWRRASRSPKRARTSRD